MDTAYYFIGFIILLIFARLIFSIGNIVKNLQAQTRLLALIAKKLGTDEKNIIKIIGKSNMPSDE